MNKGAAEKKRSIAFVVHGGTIMAALHRLAEGEHSFYDWPTGNGRGFLALAAEDEWQAGREILREIRELPVR